MYTQRFTNVTVGGAEAYAAVPEVVAPWGQRIAILGGETALAKAMPILGPVLEASSLTVTDTVVYGKECTFSNAERLASLESVRQADMLFAVGGGKAIDTVKVIASYTKQPFFTFPTIASTCAACTAIAAVYHENHEFAAAHYADAPAVHTFLHTGILAEAPAKYIWAGMGDTVAKYYESHFSSRGLAIPYPVQAGVLYSGMCVQPILEKGAAAYESALCKEESEAFSDVAQAVIVGTGMSAIQLPEDFNTGPAHAICYGLTTVPAVHEHALHGEMVAYGVLVLLTMDEQWEEREKLLALYGAIGLPRKLSHFGLSLTDVGGVLEKAVSTRDTKVSPYTVTKERLFAAMQALEAL